MCIRDRQIRGLDKASSNAQDGVSSVQTAEGALKMCIRDRPGTDEASRGKTADDTGRQSILL